MTDVTPNEIAKTLGVTGLRFRDWLRAQKELGHPLVAGHEYRHRYRFTRAEADQLAAEFRKRTARAAPVRASPGVQRRSRPTGRPNVGPPATAFDDPLAGLQLSDAPGHRVTEHWMGRSVVTLRDLLGPGLRVVVVGINPSPVSVAAGHYYQGRVGQRFYALKGANSGVARRAASR